LTLNAAVFSVDGKAAVRASVKGRVAEATGIGTLVAQELIASGGAELLSGHPGP
jgi:porphobilinogen deaminase